MWCRHDGDACDKYSHRGMRVSLPPGLYGRQREWERVLSALDLAQRGFGSVVLIEGRPGTGKTRLLQEAGRAAWLRGFTMIERCRFGPDGAGAQTPAWLAEQLLTRIEEQAASGPVLIALDDVRASDAAWLPMSDLLPQQSRHPVMWMLTRNCAAGDPWFDQILGIPRAFTTRIELGPLPDSAVADIAADLLGARPAAALLPPLQEALTAGILVSAPERLAFRHDIVWQVVTGSLPPSVHEALRCEVGLMLVARGDAGSAPAASPPVTAQQVRGALEAAGDSARLSRV